ncbi:MAG: restriction endonuclease [Oscillospiraceae bacterium]
MARHHKSSKFKRAARRVRLFLLFSLLVVGLCYAAYRYIPQHQEILLIPGVFLVIVIGVSLQTLLSEKRKKRRRILQTRTMRDLMERYNPYEFEHFIADLFELYGFHTRVTRATNDGGIDIEMRKDEETYVVEVKQYSENNKIGRDKIQKLDSAARHAQADHAIFVTTSSFTIPAMEYADELEIDLIDGKELFEMINRAKSILSRK